MSIFAKRHYEATALAIQEAVQGSNCSDFTAGVYRTASELARVFQRDNSMFDRERFLRACQSGANVCAGKVA